MLIGLLHFSCSIHVHCERRLYCVRSLFHADNDEQFHKILFHFFFSNCFICAILEGDTISERDFACPPKRRKQEENDEDVVVLRKSTLSDDYKYRIDLLEPTQGDAFTKR